jgi:DNA-directed RNA polymerase specialized sigma24 family protein
MFDPETASAKRALAEYEKERMSGRLVEVAFPITRSISEAKDLVQEAFLRLLDEQVRPWEVGGFLTHMSIVMRDK